LWNFAGLADHTDVSTVGDAGLNWPKILELEIHQSSIPENRSIRLIPELHQSTPTETWFRGLPTDYWGIDVFSENTGALRRAILPGAIWPGQPQ
jgi:hypothetical protein